MSKSIKSILLMLGISTLFLVGCGNKDLNKPQTNTNEKTSVASDNKSNSSNDTKPTDTSDNKSDSSNDVKPTEVSDNKSDSSNDSKATDSSDNKSDSSNDVKPTEASENKFESSNNSKTIEVSDNESNSSNDVKPTDTSNNKSDSSNDTKVTDSSDNKSDSSNDVKPIDASHNKSDSANYSKSVDDNISQSNDSKKQLYLDKLDYLDSDLKASRDKRYASPKTLDMVAAGKAELENWDDNLNEIYSVLKTQLSNDEMNKLEIEEVTWISDRDKKSKEAFDSSKGGSISHINGILSSINSTKERCYELVTKYMK